MEELLDRVLDKVKRMSVDEFNQQLLDADGGAISSFLRDMKEFADYLNHEHHNYDSTRTD